MSQQEGTTAHRASGHDLLDSHPPSEWECFLIVSNEFWIKVLSQGKENK